MCDICLSPYGHDELCPAGSSSSSNTICHQCKSRIERFEKVAVFDDKVFCRECANDLTLDEICFLSSTNDVFELLERFDICEIDQIIDTEW
jgi:hypothetical protein